MAADNIQVIRLSDLLGNDGWREGAKNDHGERAEIDFAYAGPFRFFSPSVLAGMNAAVDAGLPIKLQRTERSTFIRGVTDTEPFLDLPRLTQLCSRLIGVEVGPHPLRREWTHVNVQLEPQERPVDKFHFDYVPFVFVTMLRKAPGDDTGKLVLQLLKDGQQEIALALEQGESVLLQGAHVRHQANQSQLGCRVSLVTSLAPASVLLPDMTRIRYHALPLAEDEAYFRAAVAYREARIRELVAKHPERKDRLLDEFTRWLLQFDGPPSSAAAAPFFNEEVVALFAAAYRAPVE